MCQIKLLWQSIQYMLTMSHQWHGQESPKSEIAMFLPNTPSLCPAIRPAAFLNKKWLSLHSLTVNFHTNSTILLSPSETLHTASVTATNCTVGPHRICAGLICSTFTPSFYCWFYPHTMCVCFILHTVRVYKVEAGRSHGPVALRQAALTRTDQRRAKINRACLI